MYQLNQEGNDLLKFAQISSSTSMDKVNNLTFDPGNDQHGVLKWLQKD